MLDDSWFDHSYIYEEAMPLLTSDRIARYLGIFINTLAILSNTLLMYIIIRHTPKRMHTFSILLINTTLCDLVIAICGFCSNNRIIPSGKAIVFVFYGVCTYGGATTCLVLHKILMHALIHALMSQVLSFSYRYYILVRPRTPTPLMLVQICVLTYIPTFLLLLYNLRDVTPPEKLLPILNEYHPSYDVRGLTISGNYSYQRTQTLIGLLSLVLPNIPIYALIFFLKRKIRVILENKKLRLHNTNRSVHLQLLEVLCLQSYLPLLLIITMIFYGLGQWQIINHPVIEYLTMISADLFPLAGSMITIRFITPYWRAFRGMFTLQSTTFEKYYKRHPFSDSQENGKLLNVS